MRIRCNSVNLAFGGLKVFDQFHMVFPEKKVTAVLGPSGCGKTTLLKLISGALQPDAGSLSIETEAGEPEVGSGGNRGAGKMSGRIGYLFQEPRLLPWKTVRHNVEIVLENIYGRHRRGQVAREYIEAVGLSDFIDSYPDALSGGMRQRVAIARAFAFSADLMLLDEPFQALDLRLKLILSTLFLHLWGRQPRTTVLVTHDIQEALILGDRIVVLSDRPARPLGEFDNPVPASRRKLSDEKLTELGRHLYGLIAG